MVELALICDRIRNPSGKSEPQLLATARIAELMIQATRLRMRYNRLRKRGAIEPIVFFDLSIRFGSKTRPAARDSGFKHHGFGVKTRNRGTPLTAPMVGSQQKTSSATIRTVQRKNLLRGPTNTTSTMESFFIDDAGKGAPSLHPIPENADLHTPEKPVLLCKS